MSWAFVLLNLVLFLLLAPLYEGLVRRITARVQSRRGPPLVQPYFDLLKLLGKERLNPGGGWPFAVAPLLNLAAMLTVIVVLPMAGMATALTAQVDLINLVYLLTLAGVAILFGALASRNAFASIGASREMTTMIMVEPVLVMVLLVGSLRSQSLDLSAVLGGVGLSWSASLVVMACVGLLALQAFVARQPFDIAEAEIEVLGGPLIEYSGPDLALFKYSMMLKQMFYAWVLSAVFVPRLGPSLWPVDLVIQLLVVGILFGLVGLLGSTNPRLRIDQAVRYQAGLLVIASGAIVLSLNGY